VDIHPTCSEPRERRGLVRGAPWRAADRVGARASGSGGVDDRPTDTIGQWRPKNCEVVQRDVSAARWQELVDALW